MPEIRCPVLCIQGEQDEYGTIRQVQAVQARVPGAEILMLPECKHSPHRDQPERTLKAISEFVRRVVV
jgi:pimeloyl-ACP methyl ester carboxylesterase